MDFWELTKLLFRRWYIAAPMLVVSLTIAGWTGVTVRPNYSATGHVQLVPPLVPPDTAVKSGGTRNPWADLGPDALGQAVMITVRKQDSLQSLVDAGYTENFTVSMDGQSPIIAINAVGKTAVQAKGTVEQVARLLSDATRAQQQQYGASQKQSITTLTLDAGDDVKQVSTNVKRALMAVVGVGLLMTLGITIAGDALIRWRQRLRGGRVEKVASDDASTAVLVASRLPQRPPTTHPPRFSSVFRSRSRDVDAPGGAPQDQPADPGEPAGQARADERRPPGADDTFLLTHLAEPRNGRTATGSPSGEGGAGGAGERTVQIRADRAVAPGREAEAAPAAAPGQRPGDSREPGDATIVLPAGGDGQTSSGS